MDPVLFNIMLGFTLKMIGEFKHRNDLPTEAELTVLWEGHYREAMIKNQSLLNETTE